MTGSDDCEVPSTSRPAVPQAETADFLSLALRVAGRRCLVVGGGDAGGGRKARRLVTHGADVTVVAPEVGRVIAGMAAAKQLQWRQRSVHDDDLAGVWLVVLATDNHDLNERLAEVARAQGCLVSLASRGAGGDVLFTATTQHGLQHGCRAFKRHRRTSHDCLA